ncbi:NAD-dependent epimerase/dehydratase family protein [Nocardia miyunensis]|uniref:NAD-dependent epimerase/dehydratase family protein n=1 Tax=Nocardia miyunensis TaxID=282684 RepID=UPI00083594F8|nr:NAD-dependent epimerase/dehydratase family protein [Nocardia miyunensis]
MPETSRTALVIGGTGPTGPHIVSGLAERGYEVVVLHRGSHELAEQDDLEHIHADPHFRESIEQALGSRRFDLVIATYGRLRHVADAIAGMCEAFIAVSGLPVYPGYHEPGRLVPAGLPVSADEFASDVARPPVDIESDGERFSRLIHESERHVFDLHRREAFRATIFRYPSIYGPRQLYPREWSIIKRIMDGRRQLIVPDAGLSILMRCAAENAAGFLMAAVDNPERASGQVFNAGDLRQYSLAQWIEMTAAAMERTIEIVSVPWEFAGPGRGLFPLAHTAHVLVDVHKAIDRLHYTEIVPAREALGATVRWYLDHPPGKKVVDNMIDAFDYAAEDRVIAAYGEAMSGLRVMQSEATVAAHPYPHPERAGAADHRQR